MKLVYTLLGKEYVSLVGYFEMKLKDFKIVGSKCTKCNIGFSKGTF